MRKIQIGVMGSCSDLKYTKEMEQAAEKLGEEIAKRGAVLFFGAEKDFDSLSTAACRGAKKHGGLTVGVTYGKDKQVVEKNADIIIPSGLERGGGRELVLVLSCDAVIAISGGSGTLTEMAIAYQANIPIIALRGYGGWTDKMANEYFDDRRRRKVLAADTPNQAVELAVKEANLYRNEK
jgi:hypothetical protein